MISPLLEKARLLLRRIRRRLNTYLWRLACMMSGTAERQFRMPDGAVINYPLRSAIGSALYCNAFEVGQLKFVRQYLRPGDTFVDVGANAGVYTITAGLRLGNEGRVVAIEPGFDELRLLRKNIQQNMLANVTVVERAASDSCGRSRFAVARDGAMSSLRVTAHPMQVIGQWREVETITLDALFEELGIQRIDLMKIDVEGAERQVLAGARGLVAKNPGVVIMFESQDLTSPAFGYSTRDFLAELGATGLHVGYVNEDGFLRAVSLTDVRVGRELYNFVVWPGDARSLSE